MYNYMCFVCFVVDFCIHFLATYRFGSQSVSLMCIKCMSKRAYIQSEPDREDKYPININQLPIVMSNHSHVQFLVGKHETSPQKRLPSFTSAYCKLEHCRMVSKSWPEMEP